MKSLSNQVNRGFSLIEMAVVLAVISLIVAGIASGRKTLAKATSTKLYQRNVVSCIDGALAGAGSGEITLDEGWVCRAATSSPSQEVNVARVVSLTAPDSVTETEVAAVATMGARSVNRSFGENAVTASGHVITVVLPVAHSLGAGT